MSLRTRKPDAPSFPILAVDQTAYLLLRKEGRAWSGVQGNS